MPAQQAKGHEDASKAPDPASPLWGHQQRSKGSLLTRLALESFVHLNGGAADKAKINYSSNT